MRARGLVLALLAILIFSGGAWATEYWDGVADRPVVCCDGRAGCQVLQMIMMGSFHTLNTEDSLSVRVLAAVLPMLLEVTEEEFAHFSEEFDVEDAAIRARYYIAMGNCLWADILTQMESDGTVSDVRRVLLLFLDPASEPNAPEQIEAIRMATDDQLIAQLAEEAVLPEEFIRYLIFTEDWRNPQGV